MKGVIGKGVTFQWGLDEQVDLMALEHEPMNESYMSIWFYGILHEAGHFMETEVDFSNHALLSDESIRSFTQRVIEGTHFPERAKELLYNHVEENDENSVIGIAQLREEMLADLFACGALLQSTYDVMQRVGQQQFDIISFCQELFISTSIIFIFNVCKRMAQQGSVDGDISFEKGVLNLAQPIALSVRMNMIREYLEFAVQGFLPGELQPGKKNIKVSRMLDELITHYNQLNLKIESGWNLAMRFALFPEERPTTREMFLKLENELKVEKDASRKIEVNKFCHLANSLNRRGPMVDALLNLNSIS